MKKKTVQHPACHRNGAGLATTGAAAYQEVIYDDPKPWEIHEYDEHYYGWNYGYDYYGRYSIDYVYDSREGEVDGPSWSDGDEWVSFSVWPEKGYEIDNIEIWSRDEGTEYLGTNTYFWMPYDDVTVYVEFKETDDVWDDGDYDLDCSVDPWRGATATFYDEDDRAISSADAGDKVTLTVSAEKGYKIDSVWSSEAGWVYSDYYWQYNDSYFTYSFTMPEDDVYFGNRLTGDSGQCRDTSTATTWHQHRRHRFAGRALTSRRLYGHAAHNRIVPNSSPSVARTFIRITRNSKDWNSFSFTMPGSDVEIHVTYTDDYHEITMDVGRNGTATPDAEPSGYFGYVYYGIDGERIYVNATPDKGYEVKSVSVTDEKGKKVSVYETLKENQYYFTMPESDVTVTVEFQYRELINPFTDVKTTDWFYDAVSYVYTEGLMTGTGSYTFSPNGTTSRAMLVTICGVTRASPTSAATASTT